MLMPAGVFGLGRSSGRSVLVNARPNPEVTGNFGNEAVAFLSVG
jgi:hypothetical protein